jgi:hypothetical protein
VKNDDFQEEPDVVVTDGTVTTGIEITQFHLVDGKRADSEPQQALRRRGVVQEAQKLYRAEGGKAVELTFSFRYISADRRKALPAVLAAFAKRIEGKIGETIILEFEAAPKEVGFVWNAGEYENPQWKAQQVHSPALMLKGRLEEIIRGKEKKVPAYQECDAYWLLIVVEFFDPAQDQEIRIDDPRVHSDVFDRIIIYKTVENRILTVKRATAD